MMPEPSTRLPLFEAFPGLEAALPWRSIGKWPTPIQHAPDFGKAHGLSHVYIKREDLSHDVCGGNKVRGLEFLLGHVEHIGGPRTLVTLSSVGSHHICRTAWHARQIGADTVAVVVPQAAAPYVRGNLRVGAAAQARYVPANYVTAPPRMLVELLRPANWRGGRPPYFVPPGGTCARACVGHAGAALELARQVRAGEMPEPDFIYVALGSLGTAAGLVLGCKLAGLRSRVVGVTVSYRWFCTPGRIARVARRALRFMRRRDSRVPEVSISAGNIDVVHEALGEGYACFTEAGIRLTGVLQDHESVLLDGTYTAKALDGALQFIARRGAADRVHLFWHTFARMKEEAEEGPMPAGLPAALRRYFE